MKKTIQLMLLILAAFFIYSAALAEQWQDYEYSILDDGTAEITGYSGYEKKVNIPSDLDGHSVTSIGEYAFYRSSSLTSVIIPGSVTSIGAKAFSQCERLISVIILGQRHFHRGGGILQLQQPKVGYYGNNRLP